MSKVLNAVYVKPRYLARGAIILEFEVPQEFGEEVFRVLGSPKTDESTWFQIRPLADVPDGELA